ncbi:MAG: ATP-binding protein [Lachnospiraceae bacterium]|nr:ATP-binding protein [Lachnospiraceae bacterium]
MKGKEAIIFIGIQASGKTSYYHQYLSVYEHVNLDRLHTRNKENLLLQECIQDEKSFVVDNTNPTVQDRERYIRLARDKGYSVHGYYFQSAITDCMERNSQREGKARVPDKALACMHSKLELPKLEEGFDKLYYVRIEDGRFVTEEWKDK